MRYHVVDSDTVEFVFDATALREFLRVGATTLGEMDERGQASAK